jgi:e3 binding domain
VATKSKKSSSSNRGNSRRTRAGGKSRRARSASNGQSMSPRSDARSASQKTEKYRFAKNVEGDATVAEREYRDYATSPLAETGQDPDILLDVPVVKVDKIYLKVEDLEAHVSVQAQVLDLVSLDVGVDAYLGKLEIDIEGVEAQALLKVRLDHVGAIVDRVFTTIDRNPELVRSLGQALEDVGAGAGDMVGEAGEAVEDVGEGAEEALPQIGKGAGEAVDQVGQGAGQAVGDVGEGAGGAVEELGPGAGQAVGDVGQGAGQAVGDVGEGAGQAVGDVGEGAGQLVGATEQALAGGGAGPAKLTAAPKIAKEHAKNLAKTVAGEVGSAASEEAHELGKAATRKVQELANRRRERRMEKHPATDAARNMAQQLGIDVADIEGSGKDGRVTVNDVKQIAKSAGGQ